MKGSSTVLVFLALLAIGGCAFFDKILSPSPNLVSTFEASLAAGDNLAMGYAQFCIGSPKSKLCTVSALQKIQSARDKAYTAVTLAEENETANLVTSAQNALNAYQAIVNIYKIQP